MDARPKMDVAQWAIIEEIGRDLKTYSEMLVVMDLDDPFVDLLRGWSHALAVLAWEMYDSSASLVRAGRLRGAFALGRTLLDYYFRLNYYTVDVALYMKGWEYREGELLPAGCPDLFKTIAWRDWTNMDSKMMWYMAQLSEHDMRGLDDNERNTFENMLTKEWEQYQTAVSKMMKKLPGVPEHVSTLKVEYGMRSGYLHGDQSALYELFVSARDRPGAHASYQGRFSEQRVLGSNAQLALLFMDAIGGATGRPYATNVLGPKLFKAFRGES